MGKMLLIGVLAVILLVAIVLAVAAKNPEAKKLMKMIAAGAAVTTVLATTMFSLTVVQARDVGVNVAFGKPVQVFDNGLHWKAPWSSVEILDGAVQNDIYSSESAVRVRLGNNSIATADTSIQWRLKTDDAMNIYKDYRNFDNIRSNLVDRNFRAALNEVMADYNPLDPEEMAKGGADLTSIAAEVQTKMEEKIGTQIEVRAVNITLINFDEATQTRIDELQSEIARTRIAEQKKETSTAEAESNEILEQSISEEVLISKCLDIVEESGQSPIGCFPGSTPQTVKMIEDQGGQPKQEG